MRITWLGHSAFRLEFGSSVILVDPFLTGNPAFSGDPVAAAAGATHIALTHGHSDHVGDTVAIAQRTGAVVIGNFELCMWLGRQGLEKMEPMNTGGSIELGDFSVALTIAFHSSGQLDENGVSQNLGLPNGLVVTPKVKNEPTIYHLGDTDIFSDMALIAEIYKPDVAMVPMGDRFTMGPRLAAMAAKRFLPQVKTIIPCHYATFPVLVQSPEPFLAEMGDQRNRVLVPEKGAPFTL
ncbi:MAG: metal-dependent hydrolase [Acetobacteraceae bacterium]|nr:metal-dependent hydrolase [Acetobacteraceae bacterium]